MLRQILLTVSLALGCLLFLMIPKSRGCVGWSPRYVCYPARHLAETTYSLACLDNVMNALLLQITLCLLTHCHCLRCEPRLCALQVQQHSHTSTCTKHGGANCRFKYPRPLSEHTRLLQPGEQHCRRDMRPCDFFLTERSLGRSEWFLTTRTSCWHGEPTWTYSWWETNMVRMSMCWAT